MKIHVLKKQRVRSKVTSRKVGVGLKRRWELNKRRLGWRIAWWRSTEKKEASHFLGLRGRHQYSDQHSSRIRARCVPSAEAGTDEEEDQWSIPLQKDSEEKGKVIPTSFLKIEGRKSYVEAEKRRKREDCKIGRSWWCVGRKSGERRQFVELVGD